MAKPENGHFDDLRITLAIGTAGTLSIPLPTGSTARKARILLAEPKGGVAAVARLYGNGKELRLHVEAGRDAPVGSATAKVYVALDGEKDEKTFGLTIDVQTPSRTIIPAGFAPPSRDRYLIEDGDFVAVADELLVMLPILSPTSLAPPDGRRPKDLPKDFVLACSERDMNPDLEGRPVVLVRKGSAEAYLCTIAAELDARFLGYVPQTRTFQLVFPSASSPEELGKIREVILRTFPGVNVVSRNHAMRGAPHEAADATPGGASNQGIYQRIRLQREGNADSAWHHATAAPAHDPDALPGHSQTFVAVIDCDFHPHDDLGDQVTGTQTGDEIGYHGLGSAGLIAATGSMSHPPSQTAPSGSFIAGAAWENTVRVIPTSFPDIPDGPESPDLPQSDCGTVASVQVAMIQAVDEGPGGTMVALVNMTVAPATGVTDLNGHLEVVTESLPILDQAVLYGQRSAQEVLWVFPAGNNAGQDAGCQAPAALTRVHPLEVLTVANANVNGPTSVLAGGSNAGAHVSVAGPGAGLQSLHFGNNQDGNQSFGGTSGAAALVAGIASLAISAQDANGAPNWPAWKLKQCIMESATPLQGTSGRIGLIDAADAMPVTADPDSCRSDAAPPAPGSVDILFAFDTTGSMGQEITTVRDNAQQILEGLQNLFPPGTTIRFGVVSYRDHPGHVNSAACGSTYQATYGNASDTAFETIQPLSQLAGTDIFDGITAQGGRDLPESYAHAFHEIAHAFASDPGAGDLRIVLNFGDSFPHDTDLSGRLDRRGQVVNANCAFDGAFSSPCRYRIDNPPFNAVFPHSSGLGLDTGRDPGAGAPAVPCNHDADPPDRYVDFQEDALSAFEAAGIRLVHFDSSGDRAAFGPFWTRWSAGTGGAYVPLDASGRPPLGLDMSKLVISMVRQVAGIPVAAMAPATCNL